MYLTILFYINFLYVTRIVNQMTEREQPRIWLDETESDCEHFVGQEDLDEVENGFVETLSGMNCITR